MDPYIKITTNFTKKKFGSKVIDRQYFRRKTGLESKKQPTVVDFSIYQNNTLTIGISISQYSFLPIITLQCIEDFYSCI